MRIINAELRYYLHLDPDGLTTDEWAYHAKSLEWIREKESKGEVFKLK